MKQFLAGQPVGFLLVGAQGIRVDSLTQILLVIRDWCLAETKQRGHTGNMKSDFSTLTRVLLLSVALAAGAHAAAAQDAPTLPGGAGSLTETHGDWTVSCVIRDVGGKPAKLCAISQEQQDGKTRQRVLRIELQPKGKQAEGVAILPFGLALGDGVTLQVDDGEAGLVLPFSTCLPAGCLVPIGFGPEMLKSLSAAAKLKLNARPSGAADAQKTVTLSASLKGFDSAFKRASELLK